MENICSEKFTGKTMTVTFMFVNNNEKEKKRDLANRVS